jgi:hypothetical protein
MNEILNFAELFLSYFPSFPYSFIPSYQKKIVCITGAIYLRHFPWPREHCLQSRLPFQERFSVQQGGE